MWTYYLKWLSSVTFVYFSLVPRLIHRSLHHGGLPTPADRAECWLLRRGRHLQITAHVPSYQSAESTASTADYQVRNTKTKCMVWALEDIFFYAHFKMAEGWWCWLGNLLLIRIWIARIENNFHFFGVCYRSSSCAKYMFNTYLTIFTRVSNPRKH